MGTTLDLLQLQCADLKMKSEHPLFIVTKQHMGTCLLLCLAHGGADAYVFSIKV